MIPLSFYGRKNGQTSFLKYCSFPVTLITTLLAGTLQQGINPLEHPGMIWQGIPFPLPS